MVREGILTSERVDLLSESAELFYRRIMSVVDDYGRFTANAVRLRSACYPLRIDSKTNSDIELYLAECQDAKLLAIYSVEGKRFLQLNDFNQRFRSATSKYPSPDGQNVYACHPDVGHVSDKCPTNDERVTDLVRGSARALTETRDVDVDVDEIRDKSARSSSKSKDASTALSDGEKEAASLRPKRAVVPTLDELALYCVELGLPHSDAEHFDDTWKANGFRTKTGPIKDWRAVVRLYKRNGWLPSQKQFNGKSTHTTESDHLTEWGKRNGIKVW